MRWQELKQSTIDDILAWAEAQPWCRAMACCGQDSQWHSEGDVWTHTRMVCRRLSELEDWQALNSDERLILAFTALFHDAAKPMTSRIDPETGRISSPNHAVKGEYLTRSILRDLGCNLVTREAIARMVRYHGRPIFLLERTEPQNEVIRLSWLVSNRLLYLFALADSRGRDTASKARREETLHYWKLLAEENNCYDRPYSFANDHARFLFYRQRLDDLHYVPFENFSCVVTMISGLPGSGKDTWLAEHRNNLPVVSLDDIRKKIDVDPTRNQGEVVRLARERCREFLRAKTPFALNATNTTKQTRKRWIDLFHDYNVRIDLVYVEPPFERLLSQNKGRDNPVPEKVLRYLAAKCDPPTWAESHNLLMVDTDTT